MTYNQSYRLPISAGLILDYLSRQSVKSYFVGGVIRDSLISSNPSTTADIDVVIEGNALVSGKRMADDLGGIYVELDSKHKICRVILNTNSVDAYFDIASTEEGIERDLGNRDFTINAIALDLSHIKTHGERQFFNRSNLIDPFGGVSDIDKRILRSVSSTSIRDDPVRMIRAVRIIQKFGLSISNETSEEIKMASNLLENVALERIRDEFLKIFSMKGTPASLRLMDDLGILERILPEIGKSRNVTQPNEHFWPVFDHLIECVSKLEKILQNDNEIVNEPEDFALGLIPSMFGRDEYFREKIGDGQTRLTLCKLACLLHDIAKPSTKTVDEHGRIRFIGHDNEGAEMAKTILHRLRLSKVSISLVVNQIKYHLRPSQMAPKDEMPSNKAIFRYFRDLKEASIDNLFLNMADYMSARGPLLEKEEWKRHCATINHIISKGFIQKTPQKPPRLITGHDIMAGLRLSPGPHIGMLIDEVTESFVEGIVTTKEEAMTLVRKLVESGEYFEKKR
jgi:poly(A) polymerase